jgi:hypothetical protein
VERIVIAGLDRQRLRVLLPGGAESASASSPALAFACSKSAKPQL